MSGIKHEDKFNLDEHGLIIGRKEAPPQGGVTSSEGLRYNEGKAPLHMVPLHLLEGAARVFHDVTTREVNPYPPWNWLKEQDWSVPYACMMRHLSKWQMGEDNDPETGRSHLHHAMCNLLMLTHYAEQYPNRDDRPKP